MTYRVLFARCFVLLVMSVTASFCPARPASAQTYTFRLLHTFTDGADGGFPAYALLADSQGNLYGGTDVGGANGDGTLYKYSAASGLQTLAAFNGSNGIAPAGTLIADSQGNLYGTAVSGGTGVGAAGGDGTIFKYSASGGLQALYNFTGGGDGSKPQSGLLLDSQGNLYGTTTQGTATHEGTLFKYNPASGFQTLVNFNGSNGGDSYAGVIADSQGNLYGTTSFGGSGPPYVGTIFKYSASSGLQTLASFNIADGSAPQANLVADSQGNLYGTAYLGGSTPGSSGQGDGTLFEYSASGGLQTLVSFNGANGANSLSNLIFDSQGNLYGTTQNGGANDLGTVFKYSASGGLQTLFTFPPDPITSGINTDGANPWGGLVEDSQGDLFGTAQLSGADGFGTLWELQPAATPEPGSLALLAGLVVSGAGLLRCRRLR